MNTKEKQVLYLVHCSSHPLICGQQMIEWLYHLLQTSKTCKNVLRPLCGNPRRMKMLNMWVINLNFSHIWNCVISNLIKNKVMWVWTIFDHSSMNLMTGPWTACYRVNLTKRQQNTVYSVLLSFHTNVEKWRIKTCRLLLYSRCKVGFSFIVFTIYDYFLHLKMGTIAQQFWFHLQSQSEVNL